MRSGDDNRFVRDRHSTAILNTDSAGFTQYKLERDRLLHQQHTDKEVVLLRSELTEIKQMLRQLLDGK